jgi:hypothetical protein
MVTVSSILVVTVFGPGCSKHPGHSLDCTGVRTGVKEGEDGEKDLT